MLNRVMHAMEYKHNSWDYVTICFDFLFPCGVIHAIKRADHAESHDGESLLKAENRYTHPAEGILIESFMSDMQSRNGMRNFYVFASSASNTAILYGLTKLIS